MTLPGSSNRLGMCAALNLDCNSLGDGTDERASTSNTRLLHLVALALAVAGTLFWFYTFYAIAQLPEGDGTGMQWIAVVPLGAIFLVFTFPALILALTAKENAVFLSVLLGLAGVAAFVWLWSELVAEFAS